MFQLLTLVLMALAAPNVCVTATVVGITCRLKLGPTGLMVAAPVARALLVGDAGMVMLLVDGPTVSTPALKLRVGVILAVAAPVPKTPVAWLYCGAGILMFQLLTPVVMALAAPNVCVTATVVGITCRLKLGPTGLIVPAPVASALVVGADGMAMLFVDGPTVSIPALK